MSRVKIRDRDTTAKSIMKPSDIGRSFTVEKRAKEPTKEWTKEKTKERNNLRTDLRKLDLVARYPHQKLVKRATDSYPVVRRERTQNTPSTLLPKL